MLKSFTSFINESDDFKQDFIKDLAQKLIKKIRAAHGQESDHYETFGGMEFREPFSFDLKLELRRDSTLTVKSDEHFKNLPWEQLNYSKHGYCIDANTKVNSGDLMIPKIIVTLIMNPKAEPGLYEMLHARIIDILTHELNHVDQVGIQKDPFTENPSDSKTRGAAKKNYKYFLLNDEVESMVEGMYARSQYLETPLDYVFADYLQPFVQSKYITADEYQIVLETWVKYALGRYPDATFSNKVDKIVNSL